MLRYRLWDLDRLVSRTVTYAAVTALLLVPYLLVVATRSTWTPCAASCWGVVDQTMQPARASLWLRSAAGSPASSGQEPLGG